MLINKPLATSLPEYNDIKSLMKAVFPKHERLPFWFLRLMTLRSSIDFDVYYDNNQFVGISYTVSSKKSVFVLYLAISEK